MLDLIKEYPMTTILIALVFFGIVYLMMKNKTLEFFATRPGAKIVPAVAVVQSLPASQCVQLTAKEYSVFKSAMTTSITNLALYNNPYYFKQKLIYGLDVLSCENIKSMYSLIQANIDPGYVIGLYTLSLLYMYGYSKPGIISYCDAMTLLNEIKSNAKATKNTAVYTGIDTIIKSIISIETQIKRKIVPC